PGDGADRRTEAGRRRCRSLADGSGRGPGQTIAHHEGDGAGAAHGFVRQIAGGDAANPPAGADGVDAVRGGQAGSRTCPGLYGTTVACLVGPAGYGDVRSFGTT